MSAFKSNARGTFVLKRSYAGLPPIRRASGTTDAELLEKMEEMCDALYSHDPPRHDLLEGIASGRLKAIQVYARWRQGRVDTIPGADLLPPLLETFKAWAKRAEGGEEHQRSRLKAYKRWAKIAKAETTVGDLPTILKADREGMRDKGVSFNNGRAAAMAFIRDTISKRHPLHSAVADVPILKVTKGKRRRAMTVEQLRELVLKLGHPCGGMAWTMALTGMGNTDYWTTPWEAVPPTHAEIHGTKRGGRDRIVPYPGALTQPLVSESTFKRRMKATGMGRTIYDLRRTFAVLMSNAGIPEARRAVYMGHVGAKTMTQWYEMSAEIQDYLREDAEAMRAYLGTQGPAVRVMA